MIDELKREDYYATKMATIERLRALREDGELWLLVDEADAAVGGTRLRVYIEGCIASPEAHNLYELLAVVMFAQKTKMYHFLTEMGARFVRFFENLPQPSAAGRQEVQASPVQIFQFFNIYSFYTDAGKRVVRDVLLFVPRKYGKTTVAAAIALYDALFGDADAEAYITANSLEQSKICYKMVKSIAKLLDGKKKRLRIVADMVEVRLPGRESLVRCLPNNPGVLDGLKASVSVNDEVSQAVSFDTKNTVTTSMGPRKNPLTVDITTASSLIEGPFADELNYYKSVLRGEKEDDTVFAHIFQPDLDDDEAMPETWRKVNPHIGVSVDTDYYAAQYKKAQRSHEDSIAFRTKLLNTFVCGSAASWITADEVGALIDKRFDIRAYDIDKKMYYATCAIDLSVKDDFSAVSYIVYYPEEELFRSHTDYYFPRERLARHTNCELYTRWAEAGHLILTEGDVVDYARIVDDILAMNSHVALTAIGYDAYRSKEVTNALRAAGAKDILVAVPQVNSAFTSAVENMELSVSRKRIKFDKNPITPWCFQNAVIDEDTKGNRKPMKRTQGSAAKIDGAITNLMCLRLWETRGI